MIRRALRYASGYAVVKVKGPGLERFLNRLARSGVPVWDAERVAPHMLIARIPAADFRKVRSLCRGQGWKVAVVEKQGMPFALAALARRKALVAGALLGAAALVVASNFIWFVRIEGGPPGLEERIRAVVAEGGLRPGTPADRVDRDGLQRKLLLEVKELAWAAVSVRGTLAVVEVAERTVPREQGGAGNVVAVRDGIVEQVRAFRGQAVVGPGDTVRAGDVLISGFIPPGTEEHREMLAQGKAPYVRADGIVRGRSWREGTGRALIDVFRETPTGNRRSGYELRLGDRVWRLGAAGPPFDAFVEARRAWEAVLFGRIPVGIARTVYVEVAREREEIDEGTAMEQAKEAALVDLMARLGEEADVVDGPYVEVTVVMEDGRPVALARALVEVVEELGRFEPLEY